MALKYEKRKDDNSIKNLVKGMHPKSLYVNDESYSVVKTATQGAESFNYVTFVTVLPSGVWMACWTQGTNEASQDQRVVCAKSFDNGKTWSKEIIIDCSEPEYKVPSWVVPFTVPHSGRVYMFYGYNINDDYLRDGGDIVYKYSDDEGITWSGRYLTGIRRTAIDDPGKDMHFWICGPVQIMHDGKPMLHYTKVKRSSMLEGDGDKWETENFFMKCENILYEEDPEKLKFTFYPDGEYGIYVAHPKYGQHFGQEASLVPLSNGRMLTVFRNATGYLYFSESRDNAKTWSEPEPLRFCPGGPELKQPIAPLQIKKLRNGKVILIYYNTAPDESGWFPRHPLWIVVGREAPLAEGNGGLIFGSPRILLYNDEVVSGGYDNFEISYSEVFEWSGRIFIIFSNKTEEVRICEIHPELLDDFGLPVS